NDYLARIVKPLSTTNSILCLPNQAYDGGKKGLIAKGGMGPKYYSSIRIKLDKGFNYKTMLPTGEEVTVGIGVNVTTVKNKVFLPNQEIIIILKGEKGIDELETLVFFLVQKELIKLSGSWKKIKIRNKELSFQSVRKLREHIEKKEEWKEVHDYMKFLVLNYYCSISPLFKIRFIKELWKGEAKFAGGKKTKLLEDEQTTYDYAKSIST
ncbi:MAG: hypothetical protein DRQ89_11735, partial [Epsilonproteobacteria bacterium]